jgi:hypothetical protein
LFGVLGVDLSGCLGRDPRFEIRADNGRFFSGLVGVNLKSNPPNLLAYKHGG